MKNQVYIETFVAPKRKANWPVFLVLASAFITTAAIGAFVVWWML